MLTAIRILILIVKLALSVEMIVAGAIPANWKPCVQNVCKNGGTCYQDGGAEFCTCTARFGGQLCERMLEQPNKDTEDDKLVSLYLICWCLALFLVISLLVGTMGWIFFRKARHEIIDLKEKNSRLQKQVQQLEQNQNPSKGIKTKKAEEIPLLTVTR